MSYENILFISCVVIPYSWIFATIFKIYKECMFGYTLLSLFGIVLLLRTVNIIPEIYWNSLYLLLVIFVSLFVVIYSLYVRRKRINNAKSKL